MKQVFIILAMSGIMLSCKHKTSDETKVLSASELRDSLELAKYKETKAREAREAAAAKERVVTTTTTQSAPVTTTAAPKKKGWSSAAKGTAIGAATGAVAGAIIDKNHRGRGAVIGGVAGGGAGYIIGRKKDKKTGRAQ
jgi:septal ring factor EnvC (AmiA/AmiB activator)